MLNLRIQLPTAVMRGSRCILKTGPGLLVLRQELLLQLLCVDDHRAKLEHVEGPAVVADALLPEEHRPAGGAT